MAKKTARAGVPAKVTSIVKNVVAKKPEPTSSYPYYEGGNGYKEYNSLSKLVDDVYNNELSETGEEYDLSKTISTKETVEFGYSVESAPNTCGFLELGNLSASAPNEKSYPHLVELLDAVVQYSNGYTLFMNTNGKKGVSNLLEKVLPMTKHWVKVKTYKNPGSGNMLTLWVTNN